MKYTLASLFALALVLPVMAQQPSKEELARLKEKLSAELKRVEALEKKLGETKKEGEKKEEKKQETKKGDGDKKPEPKKAEDATRPGPFGGGAGGRGGFGPGGPGGPGGFGRGGEGGPGGGFGPPWARGGDRQPEPKKEEPRKPGQQQQQQGGERGGQFQFQGMPMTIRIAPPIDMKGVMEILEQAAKDNRPYSPRAKELLTKLRSNTPPEGKQPEGPRPGAPAANPGREAPRPGAGPGREEPRPGAGPGREEPRPGAGPGREEPRGGPSFEERLERIERALEELRRSRGSR